jgi:hypothetical protein
MEQIEALRLMAQTFVESLRNGKKFVNDGASGLRVVKMLEAADRSLKKKGEIVTLGEGWTPLVKFSKNVYFKLESLNPTGSFKDRGSTSLVSALHNVLKKTESYVSEDSSGNAGASIAAYAAAGIYFSHPYRSFPIFNIGRFLGHPLGHPPSDECSASKYNVTVPTNCPSNSATIN